MSHTKAHLDCTLCDAKCCKYIALEIDAPRDKEDFEHIRWYVAHTGIKVFVEDKKWYLEVETNCKHLEKDGRCNIYEKRPELCQNYGWDEDGDVNCHISDGELDYEHYFKDVCDVDKYYKKRFPGRKSSKSSRSSRSSRGSRS